MTALLHFIPGGKYILIQFIVVLAGLMIMTPRRNRGGLAVLRETANMAVRWAIIYGLIGIALALVAQVVGVNSHSAFQGYLYFLVILPHSLLVFYGLHRLRSDRSKQHVRPKLITGLCVAFEIVIAAAFLLLSTNTLATYALFIMGVRLATSIYVVILAAKAAHAPSKSTQGT